MSGADYCHNPFLFPLLQVYWWYGVSRSISILLKLLGKNWAMGESCYFRYSFNSCTNLKTVVQGF